MFTRVSAMTQLGRGGHEATFSEALRAATSERGLSLARLSARLGERGVHVGVSTLSTWQSGQRVPSERSADVLVALEELLKVPDGWLAGRVGRARSDAVRPRSPYQVAENPETLNRLIARLDTDAHGAVRTVGVVEELTIGERGDLRCNRVLQTVRAVRPTDRLLIVHRAESGPDIDDIEPVALTGCRIGRVARDAVDGSMVAELLLDHRLGVDEEALVRYAVHDRSGARTDQYFRMHEWMNAQHALEIVFSPAALPVRISEFRRDRVDGADTGGRELLLRDRRALVLVSGTTPGIVGARWEWAAAP